MEVYTAQYLWGHEGLTPEVLYPPREDGTSPHVLLECRLHDEATVKLPLTGEVGKWGELKKRFFVPNPNTGADLQATPLEVQVLKGVWGANPRAIFRHIDDLTDKIRRRNLQIEDLRDLLAARS